MTRAIYNNNLAQSAIAEMAVRLVEQAGGVNDDWAFICSRSNQGWTAAEIARSYVRAHFPKGDIRRRRLLTALTKLGAKAA